MIVQNLLEVTVSILSRSVRKEPQSTTISVSVFSLLDILAGTSANDFNLSNVIGRRTNQTMPNVSLHNLAYFTLRCY